MTSEANGEADTPRARSNRSSRGSGRRPDPSATRSAAGSDGDTGAGVAEVVRQVGTKAKQSAASLANEAQAQIKTALDSQVQAGAEVVERVAESVKIAADHLETDAPHLSGMARIASDRIDAVARGIKGQSAADLVRASSDFIRREPGLAFGAAAAAGFALMRLLKSAAPSSASDEPPTRAPADTERAAADPNY